MYNLIEMLNDIKINEEGKEKGIEKIKEYKN